MKRLLFALVVSLLVVFSFSAFAAPVAEKPGKPDYIYVTFSDKKIEYQVPLEVTVQGYSKSGIDKIEIVTAMPSIRLGGPWPTIYGNGRTTLSGKMIFYHPPGECIMYTQMYCLDGKSIKSKETKIIILSPRADSPTEGTIKTKSLILLAGETAWIDVFAKDEDGLYAVSVWYLTNGNYGRGRSVNITDNAKIYKTSVNFAVDFTLDKPGYYTFYGCVQGKQPDGYVTSIVTNSFSIKVITIDQFFGWLKGIPPTPSNPGPEPLPLPVPMR